MLEPLALKALHRLPPEQAHALTLRLARHSLLPDTPMREHHDLGLRHALSGLIGLAGGTDKNAEGIRGWFNAGYGFLELGTVTYAAHAGNAGPVCNGGQRIWRLPEQQGLVNWLGLPNQGMHRVYQNLMAYRRTENPRNRRCLGVSLQSLHKDKDLILACQEMRELVNRFGQDASFLTLNASCPNVAGHGNGGKEVEQHVRLLDAMRPDDHQVFVKLAPTMNEASLLNAVDAYSKLGGAHGFIACNTVGYPARDLLDDRSRPDPWPVNDQGEPVGGYSGPGLWPISSWMIRTLRRHLGPAVPLIQVGGINTPQKAVEAIHYNGASAVQMYTGPVWQGTRLLRAANQAIADHAA